MPPEHTSVGREGIGVSLLRKEDDRFLRGRGEFVGDLKREGMLHAASCNDGVK